MGNNVPKVSLKKVQLMPGNVIIDVPSKQGKWEAQSATAGDTTQYHYLIKARSLHLLLPQYR